MFDLSEAANKLVENGLWLYPLIIGNFTLYEMSRTNRYRFCDH